MTDGYTDIDAPDNFVGAYLPGYFDPVNIKREYTTAETLDELRALPFVSHWEAKPDFHRWSISDGGLRHFTSDGRLLSRYRLMAELDGGARWYVVAGMTNDYGLPKWDAKEARELKRKMEAKQP